MNTSTIPTAKAALLLALAARPNLSSVQRAWSHPGQLIEAESIFYRETRQTEESRTLGSRASVRSREENYTVEVVVSVEQEGDDSQATETRLWALVAEVEAAVNADPTLGGVLLDSGVNAITQQTHAGDVRRISEAVVSVACKARK